MAEFKVYEIKQNVFADNNREADKVREQLKAEKTFLLNLMSSPGSGKTTTLRANLSAVLLAVAMPRKSDCSSVSTPGTASVKARLASRFTTVLCSDSRLSATMSSAQMPPQAIIMTSTLSSSL